jgi:hypothetical protein
MWRHRWRPRPDVGDATAACSGIEYGISDGPANWESPASVDLNFSNRPVRTRSRVVWQERRGGSPPIPIALAEAEEWM